MLRAVVVRCNAVHFPGRSEIEQFSSVFTHYPARLFLAGATPPRIRDGKNNTGRCVRNACAFVLIRYAFKLHKAGMTRANEEWRVKRSFRVLFSKTIYFERPLNWTRLIYFQSTQSVDRANYLAGHPKTFTGNTFLAARQVFWHTVLLDWVTTWPTRNSNINIVLNVRD